MCMCANGYVHAPVCLWKLGQHSGVCSLQPLWVLATKPGSPAFQSPLPTEPPLAPVIFNTDKIQLTISPLGLGSATVRMRKLCGSLESTWDLADNSVKDRDLVQVKTE